MAEISPLRRRMIEDMTVRNLSPATQQSYPRGREVQPIFRPFTWPAGAGGRPRLPGASHFQRHILGVAQSDCLRAALFLRRDAGLRDDPRADRLCPRAAQAPARAERDEVVRFLEAVSSLKARVALTTAYAAGLRVSEVIGLKTADIDSDRMVIRIERRAARSASSCCPSNCSAWDMSAQRGFVTLADYKRFWGRLWHICASLKH